jgi:hypothetical protein
VFFSKTVGDRLLFVGNDVVGDLQKTVGNIYIYTKKLMGLAICLK